MALAPGKKLTRQYYRRQQQRDIDHTTARQAYPAPRASAGKFQQKAKRYRQDKSPPSEGKVVTDYQRQQVQRFIQAMHNAEHLTSKLPAALCDPARREEVCPAP